MENDGNVMTGNLELGNDNNLSIVIPKKQWDNSRNRIKELEELIKEDTEIGFFVMGNVPEITISDWHWGTLSKRDAETLLYGELYYSSSISGEEELPDKVNEEFQKLEASVICLINDINHMNNERFSELSRDYVETYKTIPKWVRWLFNIKKPMNMWE